MTYRAICPGSLAHSLDLLLACLVWKYSDLPFESKLQETGNNSSGYVRYVQYGHSLIRLS